VFATTCVCKETTCLLAPPTLEALRLCFLFAGAEGFEQVFFFNFLVGSAPILGHHFLVPVSARHTGRGEGTSLVILLNFSGESSPLTMLSRRLGFALSLRLTKRERILPLYSGVVPPKWAKTAFSTAIARSVMRSLAGRE
jgi:hypothetical protein